MLRRLVGTRPPARPHDLEDHRLGVAGAEGLDHAVGADAPCYQVGGAGHVLAGGLGDVLEDGQALPSETLGTD